MAQTDRMAALIERAHALADDAGNVSRAELRRALGRARVAPALLRALAEQGYTVHADDAQDGHEASPLDLYLREIGGHRLLVAQEEQALARGMRSARNARVVELLRWPRVLADLLEQSAPQALLTQWDAAIARQWRGLQRRWQRTTRSAVAAQCTDETIVQLAANLPWQDAALSPHEVDLRYRFRQIQEAERTIRQFCLFTAGMRAAWYAKHLPKDLLDGAWLDRALSTRAINASAHRALNRELAPVQQRLRGVVRAAGMDCVAIRERYTAWRGASHHLHKLRDELANNNLKLVVAIARRYARRGVPLDDLIQEGNIGLLRAVDKFDPELGYRFSTYATWWVRQAVQRAVMDQSRTIRVPAHVYDESRRLARCIEQFVQRMGREPADDELCRESGVPIARVQALRSAFVAMVSMDQSLFSDGDETVGERIAEDVSSAADVLDLVRLRVDIDSLLGALPPLHARVVRMRYGIGTTSEQSLTTLADTLGMTQQRLRDLEREAMVMLRASAAHWQSFLAGY